MTPGDHDVVIVGGGLTGLALACALGDSRLSVLVIEAKVPSLDEQSPKSSRRRGRTLASGFDPRVSAINLATKRFLDRTDVWSKCSTDRFAPLKKMLVWDARGTSRIEFDAAAVDEDCLGYIAENRELLHGLYECVQTLANVEVQFGVSVRVFERISDGYRITLDDDRSVTCRLMVGADGGNSRIRELAGMKKLRWRYDQQAFVTTVETELMHDFTARQAFTPTGPLAFLPLSKEKLCSVVWSTRSAEHLRGLTNEALCRELGDASEHVLGEVLAVDERFTFPLIQQHALRYTRNNLALIGDAAHTIHPLAGQGANLGFADANALALELCQCRFSGKSPGDKALLVRYERSRKPDNVLMASVMEGFKRIYDAENPGFNWIRNMGVRLVDNSRPLKTRIIRLATGLR